MCKVLGQTLVIPRSTQTFRQRTILSKGKETGIHKHFGGPTGNSDLKGELLYGRELRGNVRK